MVVPQAINLNRAAAQNWSHTFHICFIALLGQTKPPYTISSKSVEKQESYGIAVSALMAPRDLSERGNVRNSRFLKIYH